MAKDSAYKVSAVYYSFEAEDINPQVYGTHW